MKYLDIFFEKEKNAGICEYVVTHLNSRHLLLVFNIVGLLFTAGIPNAWGQDEAWRSSLSILGKEVAATITESEILNSVLETKKSREQAVFSNENGEDAWVIFKQDLGNELHGNLAREFNGYVTWNGIVDTIWKEIQNEVYVIKIKFNALGKMPKGVDIQDYIRLRIPVNKFTSIVVPSTGSEFTFRGNLRKEKDDSLLEPIVVLYGLGPNAGHILINVNLNDIEPLNSVSPIP